MASNRYARDGSYVTGAVVNAEEGWLVMTLDELVKKDIANSAIFYFEAGKLFPIKPTRFRTRFCARVGPLDADLLVVGEYGECAVVERGGSLRPEQIQVDGVVPEDRGPLRSGVKLGAQVLMVGMDRQVYLRSPSGVWAAMEAGLPPPIENEVTGLEAVAAGPRGELVAVGWEGEIWRHEGAQWRAVDSPTNRVLTCVCITDSGECFAGGRKGLLLRGRGDQWSAVDDSGCPDDFVGLAAVGEQVYAASLQRLFQWTGSRFDVIEDPALPDSFAIFAQTGSDIWSIGAKAVVSLVQGQWKHIA